MADFSKEYVENFDPEMPHDFSVMEIFEGLEEGYATVAICEGYGFKVIAKMNGQCMVGFSQQDTDEIAWEEFEEIDDKTHGKYF
jgi:hypothetical protein